MLKGVIESYMKITDVTIRDLVPKYIMFSLVRATQVLLERDKLTVVLHVIVYQVYVKEELVGDVLKGRNSEESKVELVQPSTESAQQISELLEVRQATQRAMEVFLNMKM